jgi:hypothetical protein
MLISIFMSVYVFYRVFEIDVETEKVYVNCDTGLYWFLVLIKIILRAYFSALFFIVKQFSK